MTTHVENGELGDNPSQLLVKGVLCELDLAHVDWAGQSGSEDVLRYTQLRIRVILNWALRQRDT